MEHLSKDLRLFAFLRDISIRGFQVGPGIRTGVLSGFRLYNRQCKEQDMKRNRVTSRQVVYEGIITIDCPSVYACW